MIYSKVIGTGSYLPERRLSNYDLEKMVDTSDSWIVERTGIKNRHIAGENDGTVSMATAAAKNAISAAGLDPSAIELIIVGTSTSDKLFPSTAVSVQTNLGISTCTAFDVGAACAGFNYALGIADKFIKTGTIKHAVVVGVEVLSRVVDWTDRQTCILFGDGAGAVVLGASAAPGIHTTYLAADGRYQELLFANHIFPTKPDITQTFMQMRGNEVFKVAVNKLGHAVTEILEQSGFQKSDVKWLIPHQANMRIIQAVAKKLSLPMQQVVVTIDDHGNTSAASIPLALDTAVRDGRIQPGDLILCESFGAGFTWGAALLTF